MRGRAVSPTRSESQDTKGEDAPYRPRPARCSFRQERSRTAHFLREILLLRQAVADVEHGFSVVDVQHRLEREPLNRSGVDVGEVPGWVLRQDVATARLAPLARAPVGLVVRRELVRTAGD